MRVITKSGRMDAQIVFLGCLCAVLTWSGQDTFFYYSSSWAPNKPTVSSLLFSHQDSLLFSRLTADDNSVSKEVILEKQIINIFDKLIYHALLEKSRGNISLSQAHFGRAVQLASYAGQSFNDALLIRATRFYKNLKDDHQKFKLIADNFSYQGNELLHQRKLNEVKGIFKTSHQLYAKIHDTRKFIDTAFQLAQTALLQGDYIECDKLTALALDMAYRENYDWQIRRLHCLNGENNLALSNYNKAEQEFHFTLQLAEAKRDTACAARVYDRLGVTLWRQGNFLKALEAVQRSQLLSYHIHDLRAEINSLILLGMINQELGNYTEAGQWYQNAYDANQRSKQPHLSSVIATNLAFLYIELGDWEQALELQARALQNELDEPEPLVRYLVTYYSNLGLIYSNLRDHHKALEYQKLALRELERIDSAISEEALAYLRMANSYSALEQKRDAERCYKTALSLSESTKETAAQILCLLGLSGFYREREEFERALPLQKQALNLAAQTQSPDLEWNAELELGKTYYALNEIDHAQQAYESALEKVEKSRTKISADAWKMSFFAARQEVYDRILLLHLKARRDTRTALYYSERSRARLILDMMGERSHGGAPTVLDAPILADVQTAMNSGVTFVEYKVLPNQIVVWAIKKDTLHSAVISVPMHELATVIQDFLNSIGASELEAFRARYAKEPQRLFETSLSIGERLYKILITPIEKYLSPQETIYIIPDDVLHYLPFAALSTSGKFLLEKYKIAYIPSLSIYRQLTKRQNDLAQLGEPPKVFIIGNPTEDLDNSENEAKVIAGLFKGSQLRLRSQAIKSVVMNDLQSQVDYFHFAGHCQINEKNPMRSALLLFGHHRAKGLFASNGNEPVDDEGMLTVQDLMNCSVAHIELATLSACETALGKILKGEGMTGFNHALLGSGISTLVLSLWKINDRHSADLMENFYRYLVTGSYTKLEALRQAQLDKIAWCRNDDVIKYPFPYFWASYILNGMIQ